MGKIVVGVDGSDDSTRALLWALDEARLRGAGLKVVSVWSFQPIAFGDVFVPPLPIVDQTDSVRAHVQAMIDAADTTGVEVELEILEGSPQTLLLEASHGVDLLVLGTHGAGGILGILLGSVARHVTAHAVCPTVVVPRP